MGLKRRILIDADSGRLRYVLWFFGSIFHEVFTLIHIGSGHTVTSLAKEKSHVTIFFQKQDTTLSSLCLWNQSSAESVISNSLAQQNFCLQWPLIGMAIPRKISLLNQGIKEWQFKVYIFWEGHKILQNLPLTFDCMYCNQKEGEDFAKFCGLLRICEL